MFSANMIIEKLRSEAYTKSSQTSDLRPVSGFGIKINTQNGSQNLKSKQKSVGKKNASGSFFCTALNLHAKQMPRRTISSSRT